MAAFHYAVRYLVKATCVSPLRTGGTGGDPEEILMERDPMLTAEGNNCPMLQGASIAGVLRSYVEQTNSAEANRLFGSERVGRSEDVSASLITVSDGIFDKGTQTTLRPRLAIDRDTGTGKDGQKFDLLGVDAGSQFSFELLLKTDEKDEAAEHAIKDALEAINSGLVTFGGQRSNGFGQVILEVHYQCYDMKNIKHRRRWLEEGAAPSQLLILGQKHSEGISFTLEGSAHNLLIKSGTPEKHDSKTITVAIKNQNGYVLPGSSVKGCLRSRCELIEQFLSGSTAASERLFGIGGTGSGDNGAPGHLRVREYTMKNAAERDISRTRINRITGGAMSSKLFTERPVSGEVCLRIDLLTEDAACCGLLFYALRDLALGLYGLGSETGVGRGFLTDARLTASNGSRRCTFDFGKKTAPTGDLTVVESWLKALEQEVQNEA